MKLSNRALAGTLVLAAMVAAGCPAPNANLPGVGNDTGNPQASPSPNTSATASPTASPAGGANAEGEPNNDFDQAKALTLGTALSASFGDDDEDYFSVAIPAGSQDGVLKVTLNETNSDLTPTLVFYTSGKSQITSHSANDGTSTPFVSSQHVTAGNTYYIKTGGSAAGAYTITAEFTPVADSFERNDDFDQAKALTSGATNDLYIFAGYDTENGDDRDFFTVTVPEGATSIKVEIDNQSTAAEGQNFNLTLFDSSNSQVGTASGNNDQADVSHTFTVESAGTYFLAIGANRSAPKASKLKVTVQ